MFDHANYAVDRTIAAMERSRLNPPAPLEERRRELSEYPADQQRDVIRAYLDKFPMNIGCLYEAIAESANEPELRNDLLFGCKHSAGIVLEKIVREYMIRTIERCHDADKSAGFDWREHV